MRRSSSDTTRAATGSAVLGVALLSLILRAPVLLIAPVAPELSTAFGVSTTQIAMLTSIPVLCFGILAPTGAFALRRRGLHWTLIVSSSLIGAGILIRPGGGFAVALIGSVVLGLGIAWSNVACPVAIRFSFPGHAAAATGVSTALINVGCSLATIGGAWVASTAGWRVALLLPLPLAAATAIAWWQAPTGREVGATPATSPGRAPGGLPKGAGLLILGFTGHTVAYYACSAWLPTYFRADAGLEPAAAALAATTFQVTAIAGPLIAGAAISASRSRLRTLAALVGLGWASLPLGLVLAPTAWPAWVTAAGLAQGAAFTLVTALAIFATRTGAELGALSGWLQTTAYTAAAAGPLLFGGMLDLTGSWHPPFIAVTAVLLLMSLCLWSAPSLVLSNRPDSASQG